MDASDRPPPMGWPWDQMADALLRWDDARRRHHAARVAGDVDARERAALDREVAENDLAAVRDEVARQWLAGFRLALELEPTAVAGLLGRLPAAETVVGVLGELEARIDAAEDAVVNLVTNRVPR
jgi:hypothetical protein